MEPQRSDLYRGEDPRLMPAYSVEDVARYLWLPVSTLKNWVFGSEWREGSSGRDRIYTSVIVPPESDSRELSFVNLIEAHVLSAIRRVHHIQMKMVREALAILKKDFRSEHPLAEIDLYTEGRNLFVTKYGQLVNLNRGKQIEIEEVMLTYLKRIERDEKCMAARLYPFSREPRLKGPGIEEQSKLVSIDPYVSFGRPVIVGSSIRTEIIAERFFAGDSMDDLVTDYRLTKAEIEEAVRYERPRQIVVEATA